MTAPRTDPQSTVPVEPLSLRNVLHGFIADGPLLDDAVSALSRWHDDMLDAARASQPITATALAEAIQSVGWLRQFLGGGQTFYERLAADILAALPVREDEPTGIDVERIKSALMLDGIWNRYLRGGHVLDAELNAGLLAEALAAALSGAPFTPQELAERQQRALTKSREASHVR